MALVSSSELKFVFFSEEEEILKYQEKTLPIQNSDFTRPSLVANFDQKVRIDISCVFDTIQYDLTLSTI